MSESPTLTLFRSRTVIVSRVHPWSMLWLCSRSSRGELEALYAAAAVGKGRDRDRR